jgi:hypothetical protein
MTAAEAMKEVEHLKFAVRIGLANSFRAFLRNISSEPSVDELLVLARSRDVALQILQRILSLSKLRVDFRYLHRFDIALATYLWVLSRTSPELAPAGAEATAYLPRTWWTEQVCKYILGDWSQKPATVTSVGVSHISGDLANVNTTNVAASTSLLFPESLLGFEPAKEPLQVNSKATETSVLLHTDGGDREGPQLYTLQTTKNRAEPQ